MNSSRAVAVLCCALILFAAGVQAQSPKSAVPAVLGSGVQEWTYSYDAAGNVKQIANTSAATIDKYAYDAVGRVIVATTDGNQQTFSYDRFGNRLTAARVGTAKPCLGNTECGRPLDIDSTTNRLGSTAAVHDDAGSVIRLNSISEFFYDALGMLRRSVISGTDEREYIYTADDERIAVRRASGTDWTIRHLDGKPLREFRETGLEGMVWSTDHIWRSGELLATVSRPDSGASAVTYHYHLDHLGTPRLITDTAGVEVARHSYYAFGPELQIAPHESPELRLKFTGHERDLIPGNANTLDYMHARYYSATMGRFLSVDPEMNVGKIMRQPQAWNRYSYVANDPIDRTDLTGRCFWDVCVGEGIAAAAALTAATAYMLAPSSVPGKNNGHVMVDTAIGGFQALGRAVGNLIPGRQPTTLPPPPAPTKPSRPSTPATQATTGVNPAAPVQPQVVNTSQGPVTIPDNYTSRPADNGKGTVYQGPGATGNADMIRVMDATARYPTGYVVIHNAQGQPVTIDGKPAGRPDTHLPIEQKPQQ